MDSIIILIYVYMFLIGMCVASFMNVVIDRVPRNESFVKGRSHCDHCGETLKWYDLVPIVSYIFLRGKCRYCHTSIPIRGFLIEIFGGLIGMFCFYRFGFSIETILMFVIAMILLAITMIDFDTMIIPDGLNIAMLLVSIVLMYVRHTSLLESIIGMFTNSMVLREYSVRPLRTYLCLLCIYGVQVACQYSFVALDQAKTAFCGIMCYHEMG